MWAVCGMCFLCYNISFIFSFVIDFECHVTRRIGNMQFKQTKHSHTHTSSLQSTCFWTVGGNQTSHRKPTQAWEIHAKSSQKPLSTCQCYFELNCGRIWGWITTTTNKGAQGDEQGAVFSTTEIKWSKRTHQRRFGPSRLLFVLFQCSQQTAVGAATWPCLQRRGSPSEGPARVNRTAGAGARVSCLLLAITPAQQTEGYEKQVPPHAQLMQPCDHCML